ncbi:MAG: hypothetical protein ISR82_06625 [Candidatus Marinimicrobia bacterium]|nr:hypothetical protein [Candidatus Neomarinimicrobiota bacterium]MBL7010879.1 hypothetical protein [Candidatus Neomarinimicrobiota bacterium]MBL7030253.1 hypothetical protein [Candidatus Neomarinimicrobiota bacterium]
MKSINQFISLILLAWMGIFTQVTTTHIGHSHDLLPAEASLCAIDCEDDSHHSAGEACQWFMAKRLTNHDGPFVIIDQIPIEYETIQWTPQFFLSTASQEYVHWDRGPPVV